MTPANVKQRKYERTINKSYEVRTNFIKQSLLRLMHAKVTKGSFGFFSLAKDDMERVRVVWLRWPQKDGDKGKISLIGKISFLEGTRIGTYGKNYRPYIRLSSLQNVSIKYEAHCKTIGSFTNV